MATNEEILTPVALVIPRVDAKTMTKAPIGTIVISGATLCYVASTVGTFVTVDGT